jgi:hypothetical protein
LRTQSPYPDADTSTGQTRTERFYYDGIRRIQEVITDPVSNLKSMMLSGDPEQEALGTAAEQDAGGPTAEPVDGDAAPLSLEQVQMNGALGGGGGGATTVTTLEREYIWGPGDNGVDELLVQYDRNRAAWWILQDAGGDVVAQCDLGSTGTAARVVQQWTYDAYGAVLNSDILASHPEMHCGHKGLFFDRLDAGVVDSSGNETPRLIPFAHAVYQVRNRAYLPGLGRFLQMDPNATAVTLLASSSYHGRGMDAIVAAFSMDERFGDGPNLYQYLGSNPWLHHDTLGLAQDPFDMVDEYMNESSGSQSAFLSQLGQDLKAAAVIAANIATLLPFK